jgi:DNA-binding transcriptional LysR family regulator
LNLEQLKTFIEVVRLGSFSEVAKKLAITQPAVSFQIQKLEQELGIRLIDRSQRNIALTAAGKRLLIFAERIHSEREQLQQDLEQIREVVSGELLVAASTIPGEFLLPHWLVLFKRLHPVIKVQVDVSDSLSVINGIRENRYEVGFCGIAPEGQELTAFKVAEDSIVLIVPPGHSLAHHTEIMPAELEKQQIIFREETSGTQRNLEKHLSGIGLDMRKLTPNLILGTTQSVIAAVEDSAGIAFVSSLAIKKSLSLGLVKQVNVTGLDLNRYFYCVYRRERIVSRLLEEFINFIKYEVSSDDQGDSGN